MKKQQGFTLIELMIVTSVIGILASIAIPSYQDYTVRAQISEGLVLSAAAKVALVEYYVENGKWPENNVKAGLANQNDILGKYVKSVRVNKEVILIMYGNDAHKAIFNKKITLTAVHNFGVYTWTCESAGLIPNRYLPSACRSAS
jgi:type IV pilus assembly protein PilA